VHLVGFIVRIYIYNFLYECTCGSLELNAYYVMIKEDGCSNVIIFPVGTHLCVCPEWL